MPLPPLQTKDAAYAHDQLSKCEEHSHTLSTQLQQVTAERDTEHHLRQQAEARTAPQHSLPQLAEHLARVQQVGALSKLWRRSLKLLWCTRAEMLLCWCIPQGRAAGCLYRASLLSLWLGFGCRTWMRLGPSSLPLAAGTRWWWRRSWRPVERCACSR